MQAVQPVRSISLSRGVALYVGAVIGSGILILPGLAADVAGPGSLLAWLSLALLSWPLARTFAELAVAQPDAGGVAVWATRAFGSWVGALIGQQRPRRASDIGFEFLLEHE
jgi:amino acid efflux transporter